MDHTFLMDNYEIQNFVATSISDVGMLIKVLDTFIQYQQVGLPKLGINL